MNTTQEYASQLLMQATLGADVETIEHITQQGQSAWLEQQLNHVYQDSDAYQTKTNEIWQNFRTRLLAAVGGDARYLDGSDNDAALPYWFYWRMAWWHKTLTANPESLLRQRIAQALSEIIVISDQSNLQLDAVGMASFYDILYRHAFGNYNELLTEVSLHPCMGVYLTYINNQKANPSLNTHPDENYAREIMQLFTIGLYELNADGSYKTDDNANTIPSYDNTDVKQLAQVFTGLQARRYLYEWPEFDDDFSPYNGHPVAFDDGVSNTLKTLPFVDMLSPMVMDENYHDRSAKSLLKGHITLPANQSGLQDIQEAVTALVAHPNTAPFISKKLIQQLVTSNPSATYIRDVAVNFGTQGNLKALVRAILTHPEAQTGTKLKSPVLRATQILRGFNVNNDSGKLWVLGETFKYLTDQHVLSSPTVFNFYLPDYAPHGMIESNQQVAPEFQLHTATNAVNYANLMYYWFFAEEYPAVSTVLHAEDPTLAELEDERLTKPVDKLKLDLHAEEQLAREGRYSELIARISLILTGKNAHPIQTNTALYQSFDSFMQDDIQEGAKLTVQTILYLISISPEFTVLGGQ